MKDEPLADFLRFVDQFHLYIRTNDTEKLEEFMANRKRLVAKMAMRRYRDKRKKRRETGLQEAAPSPSPPLINVVAHSLVSQATPTQTLHMPKDNEASHVYAEPSLQRQQLQNQHQQLQQRPQQQRLAALTHTSSSESIATVVTAAAPEFNPPSSRTRSKCKLQRQNRNSDDRNATNQTAMLEVSSPSMHTRSKDKMTKLPGNLQLNGKINGTNNVINQMAMETSSSPSMHTRSKCKMNQIQDEQQLDRKSGRETDHKTRSSAHCRTDVTDAMRTDEESDVASNSAYYEEDTVCDEAIPDSVYEEDTVCDEINCPIRPDIVSSFAYDEETVCDESECPSRL